MLRILDLREESRHQAASEGMYGQRKNLNIGNPIFNVLLGEWSEKRPKTVPEVEQVDAGTNRLTDDLTNGHLAYSIYA